MDQSEEKSTLLRFQKEYPQFPIGKISQPNRPDFIIKGKDIIGIEITQVFTDQNQLAG
ncbi:hypothetical protein BH10BAC3_BH10BAC3_07920 [soil metagenome]